MSKDEKLVKTSTGLYVGLKLRNKKGNSVEIIYINYKSLNYDTPIIDIEANNIRCYDIYMVKHYIHLQ